jgi:LysM repeat protein
MRQIIFALLISISSSTLLAQGSTGRAGSKPLELAPGAPDRHIVVPGDTLWSIAGKFLKDPYRWAEIWRMNKDEVRNPHRIYPGQVVVLDKSGGAPRLTLETVKLRPQEHVEPLRKEIPSIPPHVIEPFLTEPLVLDEDALDPTARVVAVQDNRVIAGAGDRIFATNVRQTAKNWQVFRAGNPLVDPDNKEVLGHEAVYLGTAQLSRHGEPAEFVLRTAKQEVSQGDHLLPSPRNEVMSYIPRSPEQQISGRIIGVKSQVSHTGRYGVVTISRGRADGVEVGHVFAVDLAGPQVDERFKGELQQHQLPDTKNGLIFVFRVFNRVSYALVMDAVRPIALGDSIRTP